MHLLPKLINNIKENLIFKNQCPVTQMLMDGILIRWGVTSLLNDDHKPSSFPLVNLINHRGTLVHFDSQHYYPTLGGFHLLPQ